LAVCLLTIPTGTGKQRPVIGLYQIWWLPLPGGPPLQPARLSSPLNSRSNVAGIQAAATTGTDCTRSAMMCSSISSPGVAS
jgi:hypothetical protein